MVLNWEGKKTVIVAVDNCMECLKAANFVVQHFPNGYTYHLVHVQHPLGPANTARASGPEFDRENIYELQKELARSEGVVKTVKLEVASNSSSHTAAAICDYSAKIKADALVLMRRNSWTMALRRAVLGSVTKYCAVHSVAPVIIVPNTPIA